MDDLVGRGYRVAGILAANIGAGFILESEQRWLGALLILLGAALFGWGFAESRGLRTVRVSPEDGEREPA